MSKVELNTRLKWRSWHDVFIKTTRVVFQLSAVVFFLLMYYLFQSTDWIKPEVMLKTVWSICIIGHVYYTIAMYSPLGFNWGTVAKFFPLSKIQISICFVVYSGQFAPIIRSLAATVSTDSIHAGAIILILMHLITADYGTSGFFMSRTVSMNSGIIGAICLSSRLASTEESLALLTLAVTVFLLFPSFTKVIWDSSFWLVVCITFVSGSCLTISTDIFVIYISVVFIIIILVPLVYVKNQQYKRNLHGPWDEAVIDLGRRHEEIVEET